MDDKQLLEVLSKSLFEKPITKSAMKSKITEVGMPRSPHHKPSYSIIVDEAFNLEPEKAPKSMSSLFQVYTANDLATLINRKNTFDLIQKVAAVHQVDLIGFQITREDMVKKQEPIYDFSQLDTLRLALGIYGRIPTLPEAERIYTAFDHIQKALQAPHN